MRMLRVRHSVRPAAQHVVHACRPALRRPLARHRATHKDLPDPPKKEEEKKMDMRHEPTQPNLDPEYLRRLADSITPKQARLPFSEADMGLLNGRSANTASILYTDISPSRIG